MNPLHYSISDAIEAKPTEPPAHKENWSPLKAWCPHRLHWGEYDGEIPLFDGPEFEWHPVNWDAWENAGRLLEMMPHPELSGPKFREPSPFDWNCKADMTVSAGTLEGSAEYGTTPQEAVQKAFLSWKRIEKHRGGE